MASTLELCARAGISYRQADYWIRTGRLRPTCDARGSGTQRGFDDETVLAAAVMGCLRELGASLDTCAEIAAQLRDWPAHERHGFIFVNGFGMVSREPEHLCWALDLDALCKATRAVVPEALPR